MSREREHRAFLAWLLDALQSERVDALVITGDVFDAANPPASALQAFYGFVRDARSRLPSLEIVVIGGNHDSAARLDAPAPVLEAFDVRVVGGLRRDESGAIDLDRLLVPLTDAAGNTAAWVAAVPFLRPADLPPMQGEGDPLIEGARAVYAEVIDAARERLEENTALIATGHLYMVGTAISELSERRILGGNQHALPVDIFPDDVAFAALGHLHKAQRVGGREHVRYAGSPIPLSLGEADYRHQVLIADFEGAALTEIRSLVIPRTVDIVRVPRRGAAPLGEVLALLETLEAANVSEPTDARPFLEVRVELDEPQPNLRRAIEVAVADKRPRLLKVVAEYTGTGYALAEAKAPGTELKDLDPEEVFVQRYRRDHEGEPPTELVAAFHELLEQVEVQS
jgi:exonuclease SbcD